MNERIRPVYKKKNDRRGKGNRRLDFNRANSKSIFRERSFAEATKQMENLDPPPQLPPNQGRKNGVFWLSLGFILNLVGDGGLLFHFILTN